MKHKYYIFLVVGLLILALCVYMGWNWYDLYKSRNGFKGVNSLCKLGLKGKVKSIEENVYDFGNSNLTESCDMEEMDNIIVTLFNKNGFIKKSTDWYCVKKYKYDKKGYILTCNEYDLDGKLLVKKSYFYNGNTLKEIVYKADNVPFENIYVYDDRYNKIEIRRYDANGNLNSKDVMKYNEHNDMIEFLQYKGDGKLSSNKINDYKDSNIVVSWYYSDSNCTELGGKQDNYVGWDQNVISKLDKNRNFIEDLIIFDTAELETAKFDYKYTYDKIGNWTEKVTSFNGCITDISQRKIIYY